MKDWQEKLQAKDLLEMESSQRLIIKDKAQIFWAKVS